MKCSRCGAENPDYAFFCGKCAADLKDPSSPQEPSLQPRKGPLPSLYSMLSRRLLVVENNIRKRPGVLRSLRESLYRGGNIVFKSESETVTLIIDKDHHASLLKGLPPKVNIELDGPQAAFLEMFPERGGFGYLPSSVSPNYKRVAMNADLELMMREIAEKVLEGLFTQETSVE